MGHHHHSDSVHQHDSKSTKLLLTVLLNFVITIAEFVGGIMSNSIALISDAFHNLSDGLAIALAWIASRISNKQSNERKTFGYHRAEILAALINAFTLISICIYLIYEAYHRLINPQEVKSGMVIIVATIGLFANLASVLLLQNHKKENLNIKAAYLHLLGDTLSSVAVIIGGILMFYFKIYWIDPIITLIISIYIIYHTFHILIDTVSILMQSTPNGIELNEIKHKLETINEIDNVHHIHAWSLSDSEMHFEAHIDLENNILLSDVDKIRFEVESILHQEFSFSHTTLQFEFNTCESKHLLGELKHKH